MAKKKGRGRPSPQLHVPSWSREKGTYSQTHLHSQSHTQTAVMGVRMDDFVRQKLGSSQSQPQPQPQIPSHQLFTHNAAMGATRQQASSSQSHSHVPSRPSSLSASMGATRQQACYMQSHSHIPSRPSSYSASMGATMDAFLRELPGCSHSQPQIHRHTGTLETEVESSSESEDESSSESENESSSVGNDNDQNCEGGQQKKKRGPTRCLHIHRSSSEGYRMPITLNVYGQPNGPCSFNVNQLSSYLGTLARNWHLLPLTYVSWRVVPNKEDIWELVQTKFEIDERAKKWVFQATGQDWRGYKTRVKKKYFKKFKTNDIRIANCPPGIPNDKWEVMVLYWSNQSSKVVSRRNKMSRTYQKNMHKTGSKSFALIREEEKRKRPDNTEPSLAEMFYLTRKCKQFDEETMKKIADYNAMASQLDERSENSTARDDIFSQVMGEHPGRARLYGTGVIRTDVKTSLTTSARVATEARRLADMEVQQYKKEVQERLKERDDKFNALVAWMKNKFPDEDIPSAIIEETTSL